MLKFNSMCSFNIIKSDHLSQVKGENRMPDYTRPPPGYLASGERLEQSSTLQSNCISSDSHILVIVFDIIGETIKNDIIEHPSSIAIYVLFPLFCRYTHKILISTKVSLPYEQLNQELFPHTLTPLNIAQPLNFLMHSLMKILQALHLLINQRKENQ